jgi:hypothetical protein
VKAPRETSHVRRMRRELQDATALRTIVLCWEEFNSARDLPEDAFSLKVITTLHDGWMAGTLTDRLRLPASDPLVPRAVKVGFSWGRGQRFKNRSQRVTPQAAP